MKTRNFGATDRAIMDFLFGRFAPEGRLPFQMPSSWDAVLNQMEDVPFDSRDPLFPFGHGLRYEASPSGGVTYKPRGSITEPTRAGRSARSCAPTAGCIRQEPLV